MIASQRITVRFLVAVEFKVQRVAGRILKQARRQIAVSVMDRHVPKRGPAGVTKRPFGPFGRPENSGWPVDGDRILITGDRHEHAACPAAAHVAVAGPDNRRTALGAQSDGTAHALSCYEPVLFHGCYSAATAAAALNWSSMAAAASRPSLIAHTTRDAPRTISPTA